MRAQHNCLALGDQRTHQPFDNLDVYRIQTLERLIQNQQIRVVDETGNELHFLLHASAQLLDALAGPLLHFDPLQPLFRPTLGRFGVNALELSKVDEHFQHLLVAV